MAAKRARQKDTVTNQTQGIIDYKLPLQFLNDHAGEPYSDPNKVHDANEKERILNIKKQAKAAQEVFKKIGEIIIGEPKLEPLNTQDVTQWLDGSNTKIRTYLWEKLKNMEHESKPFSVSVFAEKPESGEARYRIALEIENKKADKDVLNLYHQILNYPISKDTGLVYVQGSNEQHLPQKLDESIDDIKKKVEDRTYQKVQLCKYIENKAGADNSYYHDEIIDSALLLIPYYKALVKNDFSDLKVEDKKEEKKPVAPVKFDKNIILYGPPGTGKTYQSVIWAVAICENKTVEDLKKEPYEHVKERYDELKCNGRINFTTFHQSYGYEEFIEGIRPLIRSNKDCEKSGEVQYKIEPGIFKTFCEKAKNDPQPYVFIIDEINRGNISKIFGELITLIEDTKRSGMREAADAILPYSKETFSVPNNVYILATMNTADRSIALMDTALRRRFHFVEMMPDTNVLNGIVIQGLNIAKMLETINERISCLYDREHTIGHAFFTCLKDNPSIENLASIFEKSIIPLLQEYFYEDYYKIQLVLGDNGKEDPKQKFILDERINLNQVFKKAPDVDLPETKYTINTEALSNIESYLNI